MHNERPGHFMPDIIQTTRRRWVSRPAACLVALGLACAAVHAATDDRPPTLKSQPKVGSALPPVARACGENWKFLHASPTSVTCGFEARGPACGAHGNGQPAAEGIWRRRCEVKVTPIPSGPSREACGGGWRVVPDSVKDSDSPLHGRRWLCEADPAAIDCPPGWAGPMVNGRQTSGMTAYSMVCMVPPK